jgi:hypothetical protein
MLKRILTGALALGLCLGLVGVAGASDVKIGGSLRLELTYAYFNDGFVPIPFATDGVDEKFQLQTFNTVSSRLHFTYLSDDKKFKGYAEIQLRSATQGTNVSTRHAYFQYDWGSGNLQIGHSSVPMSAYANNQILDGTDALIGYGWAYFGRREQIRMRWGDKYKLHLIAIAPRQTNIGNADSGWFYLPRFGAALDMSFGNITVYPWIAWEWPHLSFGGEDFSFHSLDFGLQLKGDFGLVGFTVAGHYGFNTSMSSPNGLGLGGDIAGYPVIDPVTDDRANHKQYTVFGELRIGGLSIGGGYQQASRDTLNGVELWANDPYSMAFYANYAIPFGKIVIIPEILWQNSGEDEAGNDLGDAIKVGVYCALGF